MDNSINVSFKSQFAPNQVLKQGFNYLKNNRSYRRNEELRVFTKSIDVLLNDGRNDTIKITRDSRNKCYKANVNDITFVYKEMHYVSSKDCGGIIIETLKNLVECLYPETKFNELSDYEKDATKPVMNELVEFVNKKSGTKNLFEFFEEMSFIKDRMAQELIDSNKKKLFEEFEPKIFQK